jgi:hypothetical protein
MSKKRVALCMTGAVSSMHADSRGVGDVYRSKQYVDYTKCYNSIKKFIIEPNLDAYEFDVFCHCWNTDLEENISDLYSPRKKLFEDNTLYVPELLKRCPNPAEFSSISKALSVKKCIELKQEYEIEHNMEYDLVIVYRYDLLLWKQMPLDTYSNLDGNIYVNAGTSDCNGDFHFVMNSKVSDIFKNLYDSGITCKMHKWIKDYIVEALKLNITNDQILPGVHQEVMRKVHEYSIGRGHLSIEDFNTLFSS